MQFTTTAKTQTPTMSATTSTVVSDSSSSRKQECLKYDSEAAVHTAQPLEELDLSNFSTLHSDPLSVDFLKSFDPISFFNDPTTTSSSSSNLAVKKVVDLHHPSKPSFIVKLNASQALSLACLFQQKQQQQTASDDQQVQQNKKKEHVCDFLLHQACLDVDTSLETILTLLEKDPKAAQTRGRNLTVTRRVVNPLTQEITTQVVRAPYSYPLNLAIRSHLSFDVIEALMNANKSVLLQRDGPLKETSLSILIKYGGANETTTRQLVDTILLAHPRCARIPDRHGNFPLHVAACAYTASQEIVRHVAIMYPEALSKINLHGKRPLQIALSKRTTRASSTRNHTNNDICHQLMQLETYPAVEDL